jgi:hypothetical protein
MTSQPTKVTVRTDDREARPAHVLVQTPPQRVLQTDEGGHVILSEADVQRIARAVADLLSAPVAKTVQDDGYVPIKRNRDVRPASEY